MNPIINHKLCKELALRFGKGRFTRVGADFLEEFAAETERRLAAKVHQHPSKGTTLKASFKS